MRARDLLLGGLAIALGNSGLAQVTQRVSIAAGGVQSNDDSYSGGISADGRYVAFTSEASNLVPGDTNGVRDVFVCDRRTGAIERVSVASDGTQAGNESLIPSISADGRFVAFASLANNLVPGDTNTLFDVFVHDRQDGTTESVSASVGGFEPSISADGRFVAFDSWSDQLVDGDTNVVIDIFVKNLSTGAIERVSVSSSGAQANEGCGAPSISADGRWVAFHSEAHTLVAGDTNLRRDIFVHDRRAGTTERISLHSSGTEGNGNSLGAAITADGRCVAFRSGATNLVGGDTNNTEDIFLRDRENGVTECVSVEASGRPGNGFCHTPPSISADGRYVAFASLANNLVAEDRNGVLDVFVRDRSSGTTERVSLGSSGAQGSHPSQSPAITPDGRCVAFDSLSGNLLGGDTNGFEDVFVRDRDYVPAEIGCFPGAGGVVDCPCWNWPITTDRGCDNSDLTGGAAVFASGVAFLSADSLVLTTGGETWTATSLVLQGDALLPSGAVYGQGVRCVGGALERLYTKIASLGSITVPDIASEDPTFSARSAARGDPIRPGESRFYLVYYRDPIGANGCPSAPRFNATPTAEVAWFP